MLIITRRLHQVLKIQIPELGQEAVITISNVDRNTVKLGITCPRHWNIRRGELDEPQGGGQSGTNPPPG